MLELIFENDIPLEICSIKEPAYIFNLPIYNGFIWHIFKFYQGNWYKKIDIIYASIRNNVTLDKQHSWNLRSYKMNLENKQCSTFIHSLVSKPNLIWIVFAIRKLCQRFFFLTCVVLTSYVDVVYRHDLDLKFEIRYHFFHFEVEIHLIVNLYIMKA